MQGGVVALMPLCRSSVRLPTVRSVESFLHTGVVHSRHGGGGESSKTHSSSAADTGTAPQGYGVTL